MQTSDGDENWGRRRDKEEKICNFLKKKFYDRDEDGAREKGRGFLIMIRNCLDRKSVV